MIERDKLRIGGTWTAPSNTAQLDILSPHGQSLVGRSVQAEPADVDRAVAAARQAFDDGRCPRTTPKERMTHKYSNAM
jgi:acyl-CoA reductase-like NAD-dependent aldehyde dehydrogenase